MTTLDKVLICNSIISLIIHAVTFARWSESYAAKEMRKLRNNIIKHHVKTGHEGRLKHCADLACSSLRKQEPAQAEAIQAAHTEL